MASSFSFSLKVLVKRGGSAADSEPAGLGGRVGQQSAKVISLQHRQLGRIEALAKMRNICTLMIMRSSKVPLQPPSQPTQRAHAGEAEAVETSEPKSTASTAAAAASAT